MADEVTKRDLQALQNNVNKQIADLKKQVDDQKKDFNKGLDEENKITVNARNDLDKRIDAFEPRFTDLQNGINTLARAIADLAKKVGK